MEPKETIEQFIDGEKYPDITIDTLAVTNERIIVRRPQTVAVKSDLTIYSYTDIVGVGLEKGFMRSILRLKVKNGGVFMDSIRLPATVAEETFGFIKDKVCVLSLSK
jgi:hypothetical protein